MPQLKPCNKGLVGYSLYLQTEKDVLKMQMNLVLVFLVQDLHSRTNCFVFLCTSPLGGVMKIQHRRKASGLCDGTKTRGRDTIVP